MLQRLEFLIPDTTVAALILLPVFIYLNRTIIRNHFKSVLYYLLSVYFAGVYSVAGLPDLCYIRFFPNINLHLFAYMFSDLDTTLLNILLFLPLGFMLPVLWTHFKSGPATVCAGLITSCIIEFFQVFTFRASDINDLFTNTAGTLIGWICAKIAAKYLPENTCEHTTRNLWITCAVTFVIMFFIHPLLSKFIGI